MPESEALTIARRVVDLMKSHRESLGWSQRALAARAGLDPKTVSLIERDERNPTLFTLMLLAGAMDVRLSKLLAEAESGVGAKQ